MRKSVVIALILMGVLASAVEGTNVLRAFADDSLSKQAQDIKKSLGDAAHRVGDSLKSDSTHQTFKRVVDGAGKAFRNASQWVEHKFGGKSKPDPKRP
jgi:hypothetical protein